MISLRDYAKHRGVSAAAVSKAVKNGRLQNSVLRDKLGQPKISDPAAADAEWERNTRPDLELPPSPPPPKTKKPAQEPDGLPGGGRIPSYAESRARNEAAKAGMATLQLLKERGKLVSVDGVRAAIGVKFSEVRSKLLGVSSRLTQRSSTITNKDATLVHELIREALETLADEST